MTPRATPILLAISAGKDKDAVRRDHERSRVAKAMERMRIGMDHALVSCHAGVDPILVRVAVEDFAPFPVVGESDAIFSAIKGGEVNHHDHVVTLPFHPAMECEHPVLVVDMNHPKLIAAETRIAPTQLD